MTQAGSGGWLERSFLGLTAGNGGYARVASTYDLPSCRTQTPPELKWLLNERAALAGRLAGLHQAAAETRLAKRLATLAELERTASDALAKLEALGATISLGYPEVSPDSAGTVRPAQVPARGWKRSTPRWRLGWRTPSRPCGRTSHAASAMR